MTDETLTLTYQQLLATDPDMLEEGAAFALSSAQGDARAAAQSWLELSRSLWQEAQGASGTDLQRLRTQRQQALAAAYLVASGATPPQIASLAAPPAPPAPAAQTLVNNMVAAMKRAVPLLGPELGAQVQQLLSPTNIAVMTAAFAGWAVAHAFGVGAVADVLVAALGVAFLGWDAIKAAKLLYGFINHCMPPAGEAALNAGAKEFSELVVLVGIDVVSAILLGQAFKRARTKLQTKTRAKVGEAGESAAGEAGESAAGEAGESKTRGPGESKPSSEAGESKPREEPRSNSGESSAERSEPAAIGDVLRGGGVSELGRKPPPWGLIAGGGLIAVASLFLLTRPSAPPPPPPRSWEDER